MALKKILMSNTPSPRLILETLFPYLKVAAAYACQIQAKIVAHPAKDASVLEGSANPKCEWHIGR